MMPLDYLLGIMRDKDHDARSRLDAAKVAASLSYRSGYTETKGTNGRVEDIGIEHRFLRNGSIMQAFCEGSDGNGDCSRGDEARSTDAARRSIRKLPTRKRRDPHILSMAFVGRGPKP
jgi:hypothetical protein